MLNRLASKREQERAHKTERDGGGRERLNYKPLENV